MQSDARRYSQAGTPQVTVAGEYDGAARTFTLHVSQRTPATPGQSDKGPVPIPIAVGLLGARSCRCTCRRGPLPVGPWQS